MKRIIALLLSLSLLPLSCGKEGVVFKKEPLLKEKDREFIRNTLREMKGDARLILFSDRDGCRYCEVAEGFLKDIAAESPRLSLEILSLKKDAERASELGIDKVPGTAIIGDRDSGVRYFGLPSGYEFVPFVETIRRVADGDPGLAPETVAALGSLKKPVTLTVFVTQH